MEWVRLGEYCYIGKNLTGKPAQVANTIQSLNLPGVIEVVPAYETIGVYVTPEFSAESLESLSHLEPQDLVSGRKFRIPVDYSQGIDLAEVAEKLALTTEEVVRIHTSATYEVRFIGFAPGFPYLEGLPEPLTTIPRRGTPRLKVEPGSVAIAAGQCGIYPSELPGGWAILGRTPKTIANVEELRFSLQPGDTVTFFAINASEWENHSGFLEPDDEN